MNLSIDDHYPGDTAYGACFLSRAMQGDIIEEGPDGPVIRKEKVIVTDQILDVEGGRICVGEKIVRHLAHLLGMCDEWRTARVVDDNVALRSELVELSNRVATTDAENRRLSDLERTDPPAVFMAVDGSSHASQRAAMERSARYLGAESAMQSDALVPTREVV